MRLQTRSEFFRSVLDRGGIGAQILFQRLAKLAEAETSQVATPIISYEEQSRGWLSYVAKAQTIEQQVNAYRKLKRQLSNYCAIPVLEFDEPAAQEFHRLKKRYPRLGAMDLKIAAIALTRNSCDFSQISGLSIEDWT